MGVLEAMRGPIGVAFLTMVTVLLIVAVVTLCRRCCCKSAVNYTPVNHGLDEEEMAFKKSMEAQHHGDDIDELFNFSGQDELDFDTNDLDDLEMLQMYRSNLGAPSSPPKRGEPAVEIGLGKDDRNGGGDGGKRSGGLGTSLDDTVREAEDLEALLEGGYLDSSAGAAGGDGGVGRSNSGSAGGSSGAA